MALAPTDPRLAAIARHPSSGVSRATGPLAPASYAETVGLLTGRWRVEDPEGFAAAVTTAPLLAGHPVLAASEAAAATDAWTARAYDVLAAGLDRLSRSGDTAVCAVSALQGTTSFVEGRAEAPTRPGRGPVFALVHLVERRPGAEAGQPALPDHSWALVVVGSDGAAPPAVVRAVLHCPAWCGACPPPAPWAARPLEALRCRLLEASGAPVPQARVLSFPVARSAGSPPMLGASSAP